MRFIPLARPSLGEEEGKALEEVLSSGRLTQGDRVSAFEEAFRTYVGAGHARATSSGTSALHLGLLATGIGPGDGVLLPSFTFVATANCVEYAGARPVFADIDPGTFNIDPASAEARLEECRASGQPPPKALLPVHLFGLSADMAALQNLARSRGLTLVEDAACALGTTFRGKHVGTFGEAACFSFHPRKIITTGEGGMVTCGSSEVAERVDALRNHGNPPGGHSAFSGSEAFRLLGYNYRMSELHAALGLAQMARLEALREKRRSAAAYYAKGLARFEWLGLPAEPEGYEHSYQSYVLLVKDEAPLRRDHLLAKLREAGVEAREGTHAVHLLPYYREKYGLRPEALPNSKAAHERSLALPLSPLMTRRDQDYVMERVEEAVLRD